MSSESQPSSDKPSASKSPTGNSWNAFSILFNVMGIALGLFIASMGGMKAFWTVDHHALRYLGDTKAYVVDLKEVTTKDGKKKKAVVLELPKLGGYPEAKVMVVNDRLYRYVKARFHPPRRLRVQADRVHRVLSNQAGVARVGPLRLVKPPKSADLILFFGLFAVGIAIAFASVRDMRRRWLRRGVA
jgi:hypothetical protein